MTKLSEKECIPCKGDTPALQGKELEELHGQLSGKWKLVDGHHLTRDYTFDDFQGALDFTNRVGNMSEEQGHHPEIYLTWGKVTLKVYTHSIDGLTESDFVWAAKAEELY